MNRENKNELATPIIVGTGLGAVCAPLGPIVALIGFVTGAGLGFWFDKKDRIAANPEGNASAAHEAKKSICH